MILYCVILVVAGSVCCTLANFTLIHRKRKGCDSSLSLACLSGPSLGTRFVCVPPAFYRRNGARWKVAGVYLFDFSSLPLENDPPAGYFIPGRSPPLLLCNVRWWYHISLQQRPSALVSFSPVCKKRNAEFCWKRRVTEWRLSVTAHNRELLQNIRLSWFISSIWSSYSL